MILVLEGYNILDFSGICIILILLRIIKIILYFYLFVSSVDLEWNNYRYRKFWDEMVEILLKFLCLSWINDFFFRLSGIFIRNCLKDFKIEVF